MGTPRAMAAVPADAPLAKAVTEVALVRLLRIAGNLAEPRGGQAAEARQELWHQCLWLVAGQECQLAEFQNMKPWLECFLMVMAAGAVAWRAEKGAGPVLRHWAHLVAMVAVALTKRAQSTHTQDALPLDTIV